MKKFPLLVTAMLFSLATVAQQEVCATTDETIADPNSITKCAIEETQDGEKKQLSIEVSTRRRVVRKKNEAVSAIGGAGTSQKVANIKKNTLLVGKLELEDNSETIERIPFNLVEEIPLFSKCNNVPLMKQAKCFETQMSKHIMKNFKYPQDAFDAGIQGRVLVQFTIDEQGNVAAIQMRGPQNGESLEKEASRIVNKLPTFIPGKHNGRNVKVKYGIPITFKHPNPSAVKTQVAKRVATKRVSNTSKEKLITDYIKFDKVQTIPLFKACVKVEDTQKENCFNERMVSHIQRNFNYPAAAADQNIEGKVWVRFIIGKEGKVSNIKMRGPEGGELLEQEAKRMVTKLATFVPGKQDGKLANVEYYIPINFALQD
ncbi:energy transducer TonB [Tenacibaculum sp. HL-MS23]|uniref:energy transducer TonB n=1 Tax=unclassified Tenacibaculum TaxID=2635139 RepID=UPI001C4F148D|nr:MULTISPECIES: energy transducer TonB [unclassified Tenacibaculum]QXP74199.1 energy transducer TonB [Tenacibaculum sp. AHE14PA]QXP75433.1 energy transducer TonB [Tenacibaculum sp. AHE15PA]WNW01984.1 energy transducer TonB [Tenacibaculum sp. HL-MS23]